MITLTQGATTLAVDPDHGAAITQLSSRVDGAQFNWLSYQQALGCGCFFMWPFASRIAAGAFEFEGKRYQLEPNVADQIHPIHGYGWIKPWQVVREQEHEVLLRLELDINSWPWPCELTLQMTLEENQLQITQKITNLSSTTMPFGLGVHPYLNFSQACELKFNADQQWVLDGQGIPHPPYITAAQEVDLEEGVDCAFSSWTGVAELFFEEPRVVLKVSCDKTSHVVIYRPAKADFVCIEPVTNLPDGFNLPSGLVQNPYLTLSAKRSFVMSTKLELHKL